MERHAGFAAAIGIRQRVLNDSVRILYQAHRISPFLSGTVGGDTVNLFLSAPTLEMFVADANRYRITITAWGTLAVTPPGAPTESRQVVATATMLASPVVSLKPLLAGLDLGFDAMSATLSNLTVAPFTGGPYSPAAVAYLNSPIFLAGVTILIRQRLAGISTTGSGISLELLGAIARDPAATATIRVLDGVLDIGIDASMTLGDPNMLVDFTDGQDIAMWMNPDVVPVAFADVHEGIKAQAKKNGLNLDDDSYSFKSEEGGFRIRASGSNDYGSGNFSVLAVPKLVRPGEHIEWDEEYGEHFEYDSPDRNELWFDAQQVVVNVDSALWVKFVEVISGGPAVPFVNAMLTTASSILTSSVYATADSITRDTIRKIKFSGTSITIRINRFECHVEGVFAGLSFTPQFAAARLEGAEIIAAEHALTDLLLYRVFPPFGILIEDPQLRIRWTVRNNAGAVLLTSDLRALSAEMLTLNNALVPLLSANQFRIECRVYRQLGAEANDLFNDSLLLRVADVLDRSHPYVRWRHECVVPQVQVEANGTRTDLGSHIIVRYSALHRTDLPGRCRMVTRYSIKQLRPPGPNVPVAGLEYLDALPFARSDLAVRRDEVCDYCFFGGPDKSEPLS